MALGDAAAPDYRALPRATYTDPEAAFVGLSLEQAQAQGVDAVEFVADFATSVRGYGVQAKRGHVAIVLDRASGTLVGAAMACPGASAAIHECVLAIQAPKIWLEQVEYIVTERHVVMQRGPFRRSIPSRARRPSWTRPAAGARKWSAISSTICSPARSASASATQHRNRRSFWTSG